MKKLFVAVFTALSVGLVAQVTTPQPSPKSTLQQRVGLTEVTVEYSRPGVKGRTIFGDLVPYGKVWRTGANENTKITFSDDVIIDGKTLKKGTYALYTKPNQNSWEVIFYSDAKNWGNPKKWDESKVKLSTNVPVIGMPMNVETFMIAFDNITKNSADLILLWEKSYVSLKFETPTDKTVVASIEKIMSGPQAADYYNSAVYFLNSNKDINKAKMWIDKAIEMTNKDPKFWYIHQQALIYKKAGDKKGAKKAAKLSLELAKLKKYAPYIKKNEELLKTL